MKRLALFLTLLVGLVGLNNASAQVSDYEPDEEYPLILLVDQFSSPYSDSGEGNFYSLIDILSECPSDQYPDNDFWHSNWHNGAQAGGTHYFQVQMLDLDEWNAATEETTIPAYYGATMDEYPELIMFRFTRRPADNDHTTKWLVMGTNDPEAEKTECEELAFVETPFASNSETLDSPAFKHMGYKYLRFYSEEQTGASYGTRGYFHLSRFQLCPALTKGEEQAALEMLEYAYDKYSPDVEVYRYLTGDAPGMYNKDLFDVFEAATDALLDENVYTKAEAQALIDAVDAAYEALLASRNMTYSIESGYYFIKAAMFYNDGNDKYLMGGISSDNKLQGEWGDFEYFEDEGKPEEGKARMLWKVEAKGDGTYDFVNMFKNGRFTEVNRSETAMMDRDSESLMALEPLFTDEKGNTWVNIRVSTQEADDFHYLHQAGHSNGGGSRGTLVGWGHTFNQTALSAGASEWYFEPVAAADAQQIIDEWADLNDMDTKIREIRQMCTDGKQYLEVAKDVKQIGIITDAAQMTSPFSQNDLGGADGGNLRDGVLIDGKTDTYWHSVWSGSNVPDGRHYLQVELPEDFDESQEIYMQFTRRNTNNNQITSWMLRGTDDPEEVDEEACEELFVFESPWNSNNQTETFKSETFSTQGFKYIRFYNNGTNSGSAFFHLSELQLAYDEENTSSQYLAMGQIATNLEELIAQFEEMDDEELTVEDYTTMKAAYDAFMAKYADPSELRNLIAEANEKLKFVVIGNDPGFWSGGSAAGTLLKTVEDATAYDAAGAYTPEQSQAFEEALSSQTGDILASANKIKTGKWYRFRFGTEDEYEQYGWNKQGNFPNYAETDEELQNEETMINEALFGKLITVANTEDFVIEKEDLSTATGHHVFAIDKSEAKIDNYVFGDAAEDITDPDMALWRFVSIGDTAYAIQNKATGLFLQKKTESGYIYLSIHPSLFTQNPIGYGQNAFFIKTLDGTDQAPLHLAQSYNILSSWGNNSGTGFGDADGRRGAFFVEEVEDVAADYAVNTAHFTMWPGTMTARCYPVSVKINDDADGQMWGVSGFEAEPAEGEGNPKLTITLFKLEGNEAEGTRPFIFVADGEYEDPEDRDEEAEPNAIEITFGELLPNVTQPQQFDLLKGAFNQTTVGTGVLTLNDAGTEFVRSTNSDAKVNSNRAWIAAEEAFERKAEITLDFDGTITDVNTVLNKVAKTDDIYTLDGRHVGRGNINTLSRMGKGIYIINGVKVAVK